MKAFICDWCGKSVTDPYKAKYKEFIYDRSWDEGMEHRFKIRRKLHMCYYCYTKFKQIIIDKSLERSNEHGN